MLNRVVDFKQTQCLNRIFLAVGAVNNASDLRDSYFGHDLFGLFLWANARGMVIL